MEAEKLKLKKSDRLWLDPDKNISKPQYTIDVLWKGKWMPAGDEKGMFRFDTEAERDQKLKELRSA